MPLTKEERSHELGDSFRDKAAVLREKFINWTAVASGAAIAISFQLTAQSANKEAALRLLVPPLIAWLVAILAAAASLFAVFQENLFAGFSHHEQGRRERQHGRIDDLSAAVQPADNASEIARRSDLARAFHAKADRYHRLSRMWLYIAGAAQVVSAASFLSGLIIAMWLLSRADKMHEAFHPLGR
ncbi:hypothetical protein GGQ80_003675 [Sphingomonas jinjuensis]|uniref:SMODS and SLOG-associating 2TM effector domain-containing protein n=1 Tax=Sphingomonas jinjuensis TaxID=535907 RepID=A0A840FCJ2_9SPHN|nr:hypothetical protein [Sphingomonas jinjuensis]MBB4155750.1 hypothetical protein [Sphingomonas jinjuensis]